MDKQNVTKFFKGFQTAVTKHSPEILTGLGIAGMITTTVLAVKATPKALELIEEDSRHNHDGDPYAYTKKEAIKSAWKPYIPAAVTGTVSIACLIGASSVSAKRNAALATAYQLSTAALTEYKDKVVETIGEKKEKTIREKIAQDKVNDTKRVEAAPLYVVDTNATEFYDPIGGARFVTTIDKINAAINVINATLLDNDFVSLNDFYDELGLPPTRMGYDLGWNTNKGRRESLVRIHFSSQLENGKAYGVLEYDVAPKYDYDKFYE